jgi:hypothetical protein
MPKTFDIRHLLALFQSFAFLVHERPVKINHEGLEGHKEFAVSAPAGERDSTPA